ncbi:Candidapepsin-2 [Frankliniella fusca]|uniref:Candidapepsin-2 n=1 Tax=Frankliniella fusca TaxID=407009 RepID=A0AAE1GQD9_9NEOP|nr:Candidapepsin-2 [Frankliniella fusca]
MKAVVVALFAVLAVVAAVPHPAAKDDLKGSEAVYVASPYVASYPAVSAYSAYPAVSTYSAYGAVPAVGYSSYGYAASPYAYLYR